MTGDTQTPSAVGWADFLSENLEARNVLRSVISMSPLPMVLTDPHQPDWPMIFCNKAFTRLTGYSEDEAVGRNCRFLQGEDTDPEAVSKLRTAIATNQEFQVDLWNYRKDATPFWNTMFVGPVFGKDGSLLYYFGSQIDATARREVDEARARTHRMDTLGSMAAGLAHEINNLMTVIVGNVGRLKRAVEDPPMVERLERVDWAARATGTLTQQMLSFAGRQSLQVTVVDLNCVLHNFNRLLTQVATLKHPVDMTLSPEAIFVSIDVAQLELALINLVKNASDASPDGGRIVIQTRVRDNDGSPGAEIAVVDHGFGMPVEVAAKVTEPFFTTKPPGKGTGLGLSVVAGFCQQSGGRMLIESEVGRGTSIRLVFPIVGQNTLAG